MLDVSATIERDIHRLEVGIRQLKVQYDMFFAGAVPREPNELRTELETLIKRNSNASIRKYAHRFHFNSLVSRFNALSELWGKTLRAKEEGERNGVKANKEPKGEIEPMEVTCDVRDLLKVENDLREMHIRFVEGRRRAGDPGVSFERFLNGITRQARELGARAGCDEVELRLSFKDDTPQVKARPRKS